jgi:hypothetical protein
VRGIADLSILRLSARSSKKTDNLKDSAALVSGK